ncbi:TetR/AcrR family transcriptional regulator [Sciscionella sediminilitoris]|uniref:TetR/AcrR family transcriptional regulator n=1 Tax=Sciscionella sediminilitoris TaxID=1445613 RepID=UPI0004DFC444|nr:TetR/AcrR family transcriptional regulator [Sciscionella sp. SE31]
MTDQASSDIRPDTAGARHSGNRYGRSEQARRAVLTAVDDLLVEVGFAALTIEGIATRAGVAKQTIYRWWPSKVDILLDALGDDLAEHLTPAEHGDLEQDLSAHLAAVAEFLTESDAGAMLRALTGVALHDTAIAERLRTEHLARQRERDRLPLRRAVSRGELPAQLDLDSAVDQLLGPIYYRVLVTGQPVPRAFTEDLVREFLARHRD